MAVIMSMEWPEITREQYLAIRNRLNWVENKPHGGRLHAAGWGEGGFRVVDIWESTEDFGRFVETKLQPTTHELGITSQPKVTIFPAEFLDLLQYRAL
ncbi:MAG: hypothetical protein U1F43_08880 [Myxococcota bacterium]